MPITVNKSLNTIEFLREYVYSAACAIGPRHLLEVEQAFNALTERGHRVHLARAIQSTEKKLSVQNNSNYSTNLQGNNFFSKKETHQTKWFWIWLFGT